MLQKKIILLLLVCLVAKSNIAQTCTDLGQNPGTSFPVCGTANFNQTTVAVCGNRAVKGPCTGAVLTDKNPYWYKFTCFNSGTLGFVITPKFPADDYDWQVFDITNRDPQDIYTDASLFVACNWSGEGGPTGASSAGTSVTQCDGLGVPLFSAMPTLQQGHEYLLLVSHFTDSQGGYSLNFGGGTANITDPTEPHLQSANISCDGKRVSIKLNKEMKCNSFTPNGSEFVIAPALATVTSVEAVGCTNGFNMDSVVLTLSAPLPAGNYTVAIKNGADGNTISDYCNRTIPDGETVNFISAPFSPTPMDSLIKPGCAPNQLQLVFETPIRCNSIANDGTDFTITGPAPVTVIGATGICSNGLTNTITIQLSAPIQQAGTWQVALVKGSDGNTLFNECDLESPASTISFTTKDTVSAFFTYTLTLTCDKSTVNFTHDGRDGVNLWQWSFGNSNISQQNPQVIYTTTGPQPVQLIVSNGVCTDTLSTNVELPDRVTADFEISNVVCPGEVATIRNNSKGIVSIWKWDFGNGNTSFEKDPSSQSYPATNGVDSYIVSLIAANTTGCSDTLRKEIKVVNNCYIAVPSAFTPNNDGLNDYLYPLNAYKASGLRFRVYNRFGQCVFETADWTKKWDGSFKGQKQDAGAYVWTLQYTASDTGKKFDLKGTSVLIR